MPYELAKRTNDFVYNVGVNTHLRYDAGPYWDFAKIKTALVELGVKGIRDDVAESWSKPTVVPRFKELGDLGINMLLLSDHRRGNTPVSTRGDIISLGGMVKAVEGPNEWNSGDTSTYNGLGFSAGVASYSTDLHQALKNSPVTRDVKVLYPSLYDGNQTTAIAAYWIPNDYGNLHCYPGGQLATEPRLDGYYLNWAVQTNTAAQWWATETGYNNAVDGTSNSFNLPLSEEASGRYTPRLLFEYFNRGIKTFLYELWDQGTSTTNMEDRFGLVANDGTRKPAFTAIKNILSLLSDPSPPPFWPRLLDINIVAPATIKKTFLQKSNGRFYLALWYEDHSYNATAKTIAALNYRAVTITLGQQMGTINTYRPWTGAIAFATASATNTVTVQIPDHVVILELIP
jgi:hypothetical protein